MKSPKHYLRNTFLLLIYILCFLLLCVGSCSAEQVYQITETEINQLETNLATLKKQRQQLQQEFLQLKIQQEKLDKQVTQLENQLKMSKASSQELEMQLKIANDSFEAFAKEEKSKRLTIKRQRNFYFVLASGLLLGVVAKTTG